MQCKFYEPSHHMSKKDIDSFIAASNTTDFTSRIVISTARDWGATVESQMATLAPPVVRIGIHDLLDSKVDWAAIDWTSPRVENFLPTEGKKALRPHQRHAKDAVLEGFASGDRGQLVMACGTGKTFTSLKIAEELATSRKAQATTVSKPRRCSTSLGRREQPDVAIFEPCAGILPVVVLSTWSLRAAGWLPWRRASDCATSPTARSR